MVRQETLTADDLVRQVDASDWQRADSVVGLFHIARRHANEQEMTSTLEFSKPRQLLSDLDDADRLPPGAEAPPEPSWLRRLKDVAARDVKMSGRLPVRESPEQIVERRNRARIRQTINEAVEEDVLRSGNRISARARLWRKFAESHELVRRVFRGALSLTAALLATHGIRAWSRIESLRFPDSHAMTEVHQFPLWGRCESSVFTMLLIDAALVAGVLGYLIARKLDSSTHD